MKKPLLEIKDLRVSIAEDATGSSTHDSRSAREVHAIMGPTVRQEHARHVLAGRPGYDVTAGQFSTTGRTYSR